MISMPRASDSGDPEHTSHNGVPDTAFRQLHGVGITIRPISELIPHGLLTRCVRFAPASHPTNGNTHCRPARYGFDRAGLAPAGLQQEVSLTHRSSPSSALIPARAALGRPETFASGADRRVMPVALEEADLQVTPVGTHPGIRSSQALDYDHARWNVGFSRVRDSDDTDRPPLHGGVW